MTSESTMGIQEKTAAFHNPDKLAVYHMLHALTNTINNSKTVRTLTTYEGVLLLLLSRQTGQSSLTILLLFMNSRKSLPVGQR
jgi:hypothetical protein